MLDVQNDIKNLTENTCFQLVVSPPHPPMRGCDGRGGRSSARIISQPGNICDQSAPTIPLVLVGISWWRVTMLVTDLICSWSNVRMLTVRVGMEHQNPTITTTQGWFDNIGSYPFHWHWLSSLLGLFLTRIIINSLERRRGDREGPVPSTDLLMPPGREWELR